MVGRMRPRKATHEQLRQHNRRLVLRMLYAGEVNTRAALAAVTGLTKPTVSNLVSELIEEGYVSEGGLGSSTGSGGKRPTLLTFRRDARQVIGVAVDTKRAIGVLSNLAGEPAALHTRTLEEKGAAGVRNAITDVVNGLLPQLDAPLLSLGVALPGQVKTRTGVVQRSAALSLRDEPLGAALSELFGVPAHLGNYAELCALGQLAYGPQEEAHSRTLVTMTLDEDLELGVSLNSGATHYGSELTGPLLRDLRLGWCRTSELAEQARAGSPDTLLPEDDLRYLQIRYAAARGDETAARLMRTLARSLAHPTAWVVSILQPAHVSLAGAVTDLGDSFLDLLRAEVAALLTPGALEDVNFGMAYSDQLGAMGAVALATQAELELHS